MSNKPVKVLSAVCAVILLAAGLRLLPIAYAEKYSVGDTEITAAVRNLEIDWSSGKVNIAYDDGSTVRISEKTEGVISEDMRMRWRLEGDTLRIEYRKPGFHLFSLLPHEKELTVILPQSLTLGQASISTASADISIPALRADSLELKAASGAVRAAVEARTLKAKASSGDLELRVMNEAEVISLKTASGKITLEAPLGCGQAVLSAASGEIHADVKQAKEFSAESASGKIHAVIGAVKMAKIESASGSVTVEASAIGEMDIRTASGEVTAFLPEKPGFTARIDTVGGKLAYELPLTKQGKDYIAGDGSATVKIHTTSGSIQINAVEK